LIDIPYGNFMVFKINGPWLRYVKLLTKASCVRMGLWKLHGMESEVTHGLWKMGGTPPVIWHLKGTLGTFPIQQPSRSGFIHPGTLFFKSVLVSLQAVDYFAASLWARSKIECQSLSLVAGQNPWWKPTVNYSLRFLLTTNIIKKQKGTLSGPHFSTFLKMQCFCYIMFNPLCSYTCDGIARDPHRLSDFLRGCQRMSRESW
jgi:hypothetical protein